MEKKQSCILLSHISHTKINSRWIKRFISLQMNFLINNKNKTHKTSERWKRT